MVYRSEELTHVAFQHPDGSCVVERYAIRQSSEAVERFVAAFVLSARVGTRYEGRIEKRVKDAIEGVMQETVADSGFMDTAWLWIGDVECLVIGMAIGFLTQILVEREDVIHQAKLELLHVFPLSFAAHELSPRFEEIFERDDILICMSEFLGHKSTPHDFCLSYRA